MKQNYLYLLLTSLFAFQASSLVAQEEQQLDTVETREKYGLRLGIDLSKPARSFLDEDYQGLEITGDYRLYEDLYLAAELGNEQKTAAYANIQTEVRGSYAKLGANYNAYENWSGMQNLIFVGLRYGFATFSSELQEYTIYNRNPYFGNDVRTDSQEYNNLTASWAELQLGIKVEVLNNLYLGAHVEVKRSISQTSPGTFDNLHIPGFNRTYDHGNIGVGYGYSLSYLVPLYKK